MSDEPGKEQSFEHGLARLEALVERLEDGELPLDESLALFEEGVRLSRLLNRKLDQAEKKLELLIQDADGHLSGRDVSGEFEEPED